MLVRYHDWRMVDMTDRTMPLVEKWYSVLPDSITVNGYTFLKAITPHEDLQITYCNPGLFTDRPDCGLYCSVNTPSHMEPTEELVDCVIAQCQLTLQHYIDDKGL